MRGTVRSLEVIVQQRDLFSSWVHIVLEVSPAWLHHRLVVDRILCSHVFVKYESMSEPIEEAKVPT